jgi:anti-sigma factor RsiW
MKCLKFETISTYLDDELKEKERISVESHLNSCAKCAETLEEMRSLRTAFKSAVNYQAPFGFSKRVMSRTAALERNISPWFVPFFIRFAEAAVLLIVITMGIVAGKVMSNSSPAAKTMNIASSLSLDMFDAAPPGSLAGAYLAMTEVKNEK